MLPMARYLEKQSNITCVSEYGIRQMDTKQRHIDDSLINIDFVICITANSRC